MQKYGWILLTMWGCQRGSREERMKYGIKYCSKLNHVSFEYTYMCNKA